MTAKPFTLRLPDQARNDLEFLSSHAKRSRSAVAAEALAESLAVRAYRVRAIQAAKEEMKKGKFISQEAVEKWVASIGTDNELPLPEPDTFSNQ